MDINSALHSATQTEAWYLFSLWRLKYYILLPKILHEHKSAQEKLNNKLYTIHEHQYIIICPPDLSECSVKYVTNVDVINTSDISPDTLHSRSSLTCFSH